MFKLSNSAKAFCLPGLLRSCLRQLQSLIDSLPEALAIAPKENKFKFRQAHHKVSILLITLLCIAGNIFPLHGQGKPMNVDSLKALIAVSEGKDKYEVLYNIAYELFDVDNAEAEKYAKEAHTLSLTLGDSLYITKSGRIWGQLLRRINQLELSIKQLLAVLPIAERNQFTDEEKIILNALAITYLNMAYYDEALKYHFESLEIREREGDLAAISMTLNNIGLVYYKISNYDLSLSYYTKSLEAKRIASDSFDLDRLLINIALCYNQLKRFQEARNIINEAFEICADNCTDQIKMEGEFGLGLSYLIQKDLNKAKDHLHKALLLSIKIQSKRFEAELCYYLGQMHASAKEFNQAKVMLSKSEILSKEQEHNQNLIFTYQEFAILYGELTEFRKSAYYWKKYSELKDSIYNHDLIRNLTLVQTKYQERENLETIKEKEKTLQLQSLIINKQNFQTLLISISSILLFLLLIILYQNYKRKVKFEKILEQKVRSRTQELEASRYELERINAEQNSLIIKTYAENRSILASAKGIYQAAINDIKDPEALVYITKMNEITHRIEDSATVLGKRINSIDNPPK